MGSRVQKFQSMGGGSRGFQPVTRQSTLAEGCAEEAAQIWLTGRVRREPEVRASLWVPPRDLLPAPLPSCSWALSLELTHLDRGGAGRVYLPPCSSPHPLLPVPSALSSFPALGPSAMLLCLRTSQQRTEV